jgi:hypothetical protein
MNTTPVPRAPFFGSGSPKSCAQCGKLVTRDTVACLRCGQRQRIRPGVIVAALSGCLIAGMFAVTTASALSPPPATVQTAPTWPKQAAAPTMAKAATEVTAAELWAAYARDAAAADRQFRARSVVVKGVVQSVDRDFEGSLVARLSTGDAFDSVNARLATRNDPAMVGVVSGSPVTLTCVGRGALMGAPQLGGCVVR